MRGDLDGRVAIPAVDPHLPRVQGVGIGHRLHRRIADVGRRRRASVPDQGDEEDG